MSALLPNEGKDDYANEKKSIDPKSEVVDIAQPKKSKKALKIRFALAGAFAILADTAGAFLGESFAVAFDVFVAVVLFAILGFDWLLIPALMVELVPGLGVVSPSWVIAVGLIIKNKMSDE